MASRETEPPAAAAAPALEPPSISPAVRWRARARKLLLVEQFELVERALGERVETSEPLPQGLEFRRMEPRDIDAIGKVRPNKVGEFAELVKHDNPFAYVCMSNGEFVSNACFAAGDYKDPNLGYTFRTGANGTYLYGGWVAPAWRQQGVATQFLVWLYTNELPRRGFTNVLTYFVTGNEASRKLLARYGFQPASRVRHVRILGKHFFAETPATPSQPSLT